MSALIDFGLLPLQGGVIPLTPNRGRQFNNELGYLARGRLPTDSIGNFTLTLTNVVVGSAIRVETQAGSLVKFRTATGSTEVFTIPAYSAGSASNDLRIKVRKGTGAPFYIPYETQATAFVGSQSIFVSQIPDE